MSNTKQEPVAYTGSGSLMAFKDGREDFIWPRHGHEVWLSRDYGGDGKAVNLSRKRLGDFVYWVLIYGGHIHHGYVMGLVQGAYCQFSISLPKGKREDFERDSGYALEPPEKVKLA